MTITKLDARQVVSRDALGRTTGATGSQADDIFKALNSEITPPFPMSVPGTNRIVTLGTITQTNPDTSLNRTIPPISNVIPTFTSATITLGPTGAGSSATPSSGTGVTLAMSASQFMRIGINIDSTGALTLTKGTAASTLAAATTPATVSGMFAIGHFVARTDGSGNVQNILTSDLYQYVGGKVFNDLTGTGSKLVTDVAASISSPNITDYADVTEQSAPSAPSSGKLRIYAKTDNNLYTKDSTGSEVQIGAGSGEKNYITAGSSVTNWNTSDAGITIANDSTAADLPRPNTTKTGIKLTGVSGSAAYAYYRFTLDPSDYGKKLKVKFDQKPLSGYVDSDFKVDIYSNTASDYSGTSTRLALSTDTASGGPSPLPNATFTYQAAWDASNSSAPYIEVRVGLNSTNTNSIVLSDFIVGPGSVTQGAAVSSWRSYTPTGSWVSNTVYTGFYSRVGDSMQVRAKAATSGAPTSTSFSISIPSGFTIDTSKLVDSSTGLSAINGTALINAAGTNAYKAHLAYNNTSSVKVQYQSNASGVVSDVTQAAPITFGASDWIDVEFSVPVVEWAGSGTINVAQNDVEYAYNSSTADSSDTTAFAIGPSGGQFGNFTANRSKRVRFSTPISATDSLRLDIYNGNGWFPLVSQETVAMPRIVQNTTLYGIGFEPVTGTTTDVDVNFSTYRLASGASFGAAGTDWSAIANSSTFKWRLVKLNNSMAVGFGAATTVASGLVSYEDSGTFSCPFTVGTSGTPTLTIAYSRVGKQVSLRIPNNSITVSGTVSNVATASGILPVGLRPTSAIEILLPVYTGGGSQTIPGVLLLSTNGTITLYKDNTQATFTTNIGVGNSGSNHASASYGII